MIRLKAKLDRGEDDVLVEALGEACYEEAHLPGAINIPYDRVDELAPGLLPEKGAQKVVYCSNGPCKNSGIASERLGYEDVRDYHEGKQDWMQAGLPTESGAERVGAEPRRPVRVRPGRGCPTGFPDVETPAGFSENYLGGEGFSWRCCLYCWHFWPGHS